MSLPSWLTRLSLARTKGPAKQPPPARRIAVEALEDRRLMSSLAITDVAVLEGNQGTVYALFTVSLSAAADQTVTVDFSTADGTARAGADYQAAAGSLTFAPGETSKTIAIAVVGDTRKERDESFSVNLFGAVNALVDDGQGLGTIRNDDVSGGNNNWDHCGRGRACR